MPSIPAGFRTHVAQVPGGRVDWTTGTFVVEGLGRARGTSAQQRLMAARAAEIVAARNALAVAGGVRIDADGRVNSIRAGQLRIQGVIQGQRVTRARWNPDAVPPEYRLELEVPLWGVDSVAALFWRTQQVQSHYGTDARIALADRQENGLDTTVVIDARGVDVEECLFPSIVDDRGRVLFDAATVPAAIVRAGPIARYVESDLSVEQLTVPERAGSVTVKHTLIRAIKAGAPHRTTLVVTAADADALAASPLAADALRAARVLIIVD